ncbi:MAG: indolepyruvate oxidoreductase subunit beta family protein [Rhodoferax sp.]|nr:indolepyruvate oxidoreductase subunit beta family protein [Rhodoferax sp.]
MKQASNTPFCILIAALGGEGGGVLADWLVQCARASDLPVQATSVPGVAQRTGATSYYIELLRETQPEGSSAVFALHPVPATLDVVIASELVETARMMERGFVSPERTVLISSSHRAYTTLEKMAPMDGRYEASAVLDTAQKMARRFVAFDMAAVAVQSGTVISAVMFGALAGAGVLPWNRALCERVIRSAGQGVDASLRGFARAFEQASGSMAATSTLAASAPDLTAMLNNSALPVALRSAWVEQIGRWPAAMQSTAALGVLRCLDYQNAAHAERYLQHLDTLWQAKPSAEAVLAEAARCLALWMCFEDVIRVADLRSRRSRFDKLRVEFGIQAGELVRVVEYFKPGIEELAAGLPRALGQPLLSLAQRRGWIGRASFGLHIRSTSLWGFLLLRGLAGLRPLRPRSMRYQQEHAAIDAWVAAMACCLPHAPEFAKVLALLPTVLKGYSETQARGRASFERLWQQFVAPLMASDLNALQSLDANAPVFKQALHNELASVDLPAPTAQKSRPSEQVIHFTKKKLQEQTLPTSR